MITCIGRRSFGVLLWEIYAFGVMPYRRIPITEVLNAVTQGYRMEQPERCPPEMYKMMCNCWSPQPDQRPSFYRLATLIRSYKQKLEDAARNPATVPQTAPLGMPGPGARSASIAPATVGVPPHRFGHPPSTSTGTAL